MFIYIYIYLNISYYVHDVLFVLHDEVDAVDHHVKAARSIAAECAMAVGAILRRLLLGVLALVHIAKQKLKKRMFDTTVGSQNRASPYFPRISVAISMSSTNPIGGRRKNCPFRTQALLT